jgi:hypothetical protein
MDIKNSPRELYKNHPVKINRCRYDLFYQIRDFKYRRIGCSPIRITGKAKGPSCTGMLFNFFIVYNFYNVRIVTNNIFKKNQVKRNVSLFFKTKRYQIGVDGRKWERK